MDTSVDRVYLEARGVIDLLKEADEMSLALSAEDVLRKALLLSAASYFEHVLSGVVEDFVRSKVGHDDMVPSLVKAKAISRQYHTWFDWSGGNANRFFSMFGERFKSYMAGVVKEDVDLDDGIRSFIKVGDLRNRLSHQDFSTFPLTFTTDEIYDLYKKALVFVRSVPDCLSGCAEEARHDL